MEAGDIVIRIEEYDKLREFQKTVLENAYVLIVDENNYFDTHIMTKDEILNEVKEEKTPELPSNPLSKPEPH